MGSHRAGNVALIGLLCGFALAGCGGLSAVAPSATPRGPIVPTRAPTQTALPPSATPEPTRTPLPPPTDTPSAQRLPPTLAPTAEPAPGLRITDGLTRGQPEEATIDDVQPLHLYTFAGDAGDVVNLTLKTRSGDLDPFLLVLDPEGGELARDDDAGDGTRDSAIRGLRLPASGVYVAVATRFMQRLGSTRGQFVIRVDGAAFTTAPFGIFSRPLTYDGLQTGALDDSQPEQVYTFIGAAGDVVTIQVSALSGDLRPVVSLTDARGGLVEQNSAAESSGAATAAIRRVQLPETGAYSIAVSRERGADAAGEFRLKLALDQRGVPGADRPLYAALHPLRSHSVVGAAGTAPGYVVGVRLDDQNRQIGYQTILTFALPEAPARVEQARLEFDGCAEQGGGFGALGAVIVFADPVGALRDNPDSVRPSVGARRIASFGDCAPVDVTDSIRRAYLAGASVVKFWLVAPNAPVDGQPHAVVFAQPRLAIDAG